MALQDNIKLIIEEKNRIAKEVGRDTDEILLCAVTKTRTPEEINEAINCGITDICENKVQEILEKYDLIIPVRWHMVGHLQTNKVKYIIDKVALIHSVDSVRLAEEIDKRAAQLNITMDILIQVNPAMDEAKFGITIDETEAMLKWILNNCENIRIRGLMCIAPFAENPEDVSQYFREVKALYDEYSKIQHKNLDFKYISMGMSHDYKVAIKEGSTMIRIGTAIFGERNYNKQN
ncbi:MAG: YggS family pyridoxal phosphate-dependent enzyme [Eubacteriales bacterium]|nr:YggS family pyridoxal phosphate-dependent enzyme [Eubacteriales bacterium]MDD4389308.1 YggS family pyridoxal phosphate-dependent enzyme [Eubacteriales bacterium]